MLWERNQQLLLITEKKKVCAASRWMDCVLLRTLLQRPFQQEFQGALGTKSTINNHGNEKGVRCQQAQPVKVNRSGRGQRESVGARGGSQEKNQKQTLYTDFVRSLRHGAW